MTVIADARTAVINRLRPTGNVASLANGDIETFVRVAFKTLIAEVPPIIKGSVTLSNYSATLPANTLLVQFAAYRNQLLLDIEWGEIGGDLYVRRGSAAPNGIVGIWYQKNYAVVDATTAIDTTCIFGQDWLEEPAVTLAVQYCLMRLSQIAASRGGDKYASLYRVMQQERAALIGPLQAERNAWMQRMAGRLQERLALKDALPTSNKMRGLVNLSRLPSSLTGDEV